MYLNLYLSYYCFYCIILKNFQQFLSLRNALLNVAKMCLSRARAVKCVDKGVDTPGQGGVVVAILWRRISTKKERTVALSASTERSGSVNILIRVLEEHKNKLLSVGARSESERQSESERERGGERQSERAYNAKPMTTKRKRTKRKSINK